MRSLPFASNYFIESDGSVFRLLKDGRYRPLKPWSNRGYPMVTIRAGGLSIKMLVHRLIAAMFISPVPFVGAEVRHKDGNPRNIDVSNLEWGTHLENMHDMSVHFSSGVKTKDISTTRRGDNHPLRLNPNLAARGSAHGAAKLNDDDVKAILWALDTGWSQAAIARHHNVSAHLIWRIKNNKCWKHITRKDES